MKPQETALPTSPPLHLLGIEPLRALIELAGMHLMDRSGLPQGDGHPVVIFPGLASDRRAIRPLIDLCERLGYSAYDWGRGLNTGPQADVEAWLDELTQDVLALTSAHDEPMSLIGWSLGGIYAREVAKRAGARARRVITLGTPFAGTPEQTNVAWLYRLLNGTAPRLPASLARQLREPPRVPTTSIFSRSDGVVAWRACVQAGNAPHVENIEVESSHCGLGWNATVLSIVADRLATVATPS